MINRFSIIVACDDDFGIGKNGKIPWRNKEDQQFFKDTTLGSTIIMGRITFESLPEYVRPLPGRKTIIISRNYEYDHDNVTICSSLENALKTSKGKTFICGGQDIYNDAYNAFGEYCDMVYMSKIPGSYGCDRFINFGKLEGLFYQSAKLTIYQWRPKKHQEYQYLDLCQHILDHGTERGDRTGTGTISRFGCRMEFDISEELPVLTTKKVLWDKVIHELLWIISGSTDVQDLQKVGVNFWDANSTREFLDNRGLTDYEEGDLGPVYGFQWRHWGEKYEGCKKDYAGIDQLTKCINTIKTNPECRRIVMSAWNPSDLNKMALPPCHMFVQFYVRDGKYLDTQLYQRSGDMFLGVPFNIMSYSCLTYMIASVTGLKPGRFIHVIGDAHIYKNHVEQMKKQLSRVPKPFPKLILEQADSIDDFKFEHFNLVGYTCHSFIRGKMAV